MLDPDTIDKIRTIVDNAPAAINTAAAVVPAATAIIINVPPVAVGIGAVAIGAVIGGGLVAVAMDKYNSKHNETAQQNLRSKEQQLRRATTENKRLKTAHRRETEWLENELMREKQAKERALSRCQKMKEDTVIIDYLKREIEHLKEQIASLSNDTSNSYEMSLDSRGAAVTIHNNTDGDGAKGDTDISRYFLYIKENVTTEWKDLAVTLGLSWADIINIEGKNKDDKSRCWDALQEWRKRKGEAATVDALMEALSDLGLNNVKDGLRRKYPGSRLAKLLCSG
ncbi:uncharacterized protein LOC118430848 [Branchiostoma floridae]|uniref:Uncharacterized protein LOC118430848 n=1 Tax=Branchiostoma floridae TaxID=7739 RepID=A0A9J7NBS0_BRAFL|nr:uncharacterized protein LOC118430848 [Branchiostoma floridae]